MSYQNGLSALHLEMPDKIPRTEYSAEFHWELIQKVTGIPVSSHSLPAVQSQASREFVRAWDYGFYWHTIPACRQLGDMRTNMGHASYRQHGVDFSAGTDQRLFWEFMKRYTAWNLQYFEALAQCSSPVVMVHDDLVWTSGAFLAPEFYRTFLFPCLKQLICPLLDCGKRVLFTSDGNYTQFAADIAACGIHGFVLEPCTDLACLCEVYGQTHVIVGNVDTRVLLLGQKADIEAEVKRCISLGKSCPGYFMAVGNNIPPNTPVDNCLYYNAFYDAYSRR